MTTFSPPRPWTTSYAEGVPEDLGPVSGSLVDIVAASARDYPDATALQFFGRETSYRQLNEAIERAAANRLKGILEVTKAPVVSIDFNHSPASSTFDLTQTQVIGRKLVRVLSWYDNEWGFSNRMLDTAAAMGRLG